MTSIELQGDKELLRILQKLEPRKQQVAMKTMGLHLSGKMKRYPRQRFAANPNRVYKRTRNLAKRWDTKARRTWVKVFNTADYSRYVQGDDTQAHWHTATGWQTLRATAEKNAKQLVLLLKKNIDRILEGR